MQWGNPRIYSNSKFKIDFLNAREYMKNIYESEFGSDTFLLTCLKNMAKIKLDFRLVGGVYALH